MSLDKTYQSVDAGCGAVIATVTRHRRPPLRNASWSTSSVNTSHIGRRLTNGKRAFPRTSVKSVTPCVWADFGGKRRGGVGCKCHFRIDLHQAWSRVSVSAAWLTDVRRRKCVAISWFSGWCSGQRRVALVDLLPASWTTIIIIKLTLLYTVQILKLQLLLLLVKINST